MQFDPPPEDDDSRELLEKVDALLKRHQPKRPTAPPEEEPGLTAPPPEVPELMELADLIELPEEAPKPPPKPPPVMQPRVADTVPFDDIPVLTDIVVEPVEAIAPADAPLPGNQLLDLEERLYRELEARLVPQLSMAFSKTLNELLIQAKIHIGVAVREHLVQELSKTERLETRD